MTKIERLRKNFASGMSEARISDDSWHEEFLPMLEDAERYRWLRMNRLWLKAKLPMLAAPEFDAGIDSARKQTKEP